MVATHGRMQNEASSLLGELKPRVRWDGRIAAYGVLGLLFACAGAAALEWAGLDLAFSDLFYDATQHRWLVDFERDSGLRFAFYLGPKLAMVGVSFGLIVVLFGPPAWRRGLPRRAVACALSFWLFAGTVAWLKDQTDIYLPRQIERYQRAADLPPAGMWRAPGAVVERIPYRRLWETYGTARPAGERGGRGFPAAHASTGFFLMGFAALASSRRARIGWLIVGSAAGWVLGFYQTVNGNHFVSHTLATWGIAAAFLAALWLVWSPDISD